MRTRLSPFSAIMLVSVSLLALAGWTGAGTRGAVAKPSAVDTGPGVRDRTAWQPSPIAERRDRSAWQPSPVPAQTPTPGPTQTPQPGAAQAARPGPTQTPPPGQAQSWRPGWHEVTFQSGTLGRRMSYLAWLPPGFPAKGMQYPTLYLLHGSGDGENPGRSEWRGFGVAEALTDLIGRGEAVPMIVILPEGEQDYWINHANGGPRWADYVAREVVPHVDRTFPTDARATRRAVGGHSMGGHGAVQLALNYPDVFRIAGAHTPSLRSYKESPEFFGSPEWFARYDPLALAQRSPAVSGLTAWIDAGSRDRWRAETERLAKALEGRGARVQFHVLDGGHEGAYWRNNLPRYLRFYSAALAAATPRQAAA